MYTDDEWNDGDVGPGATGISTAHNNLMRLGCDLMSENGLYMWACAVGSAAREAGSCNYAQKRITISGPLAKLNDEAETRDTILHEIAHALVGPGHGHGKVWKAMAVKVGANPVRAYGKDLLTPPARYIGTFDNCGHTTESMTMHRISCGKCSGGKYNLKFRVRWMQNPEWSKS